MLRFTKMHGLGNDFMVLDLLTQSVNLTPRLVSQWGDRRTGVGFDQLLTLEAPQNPETDFRFGIYNTDGSQAQQCGNGARCMARFIADAGLSPKPSVLLDCPGGVFEVGLVDADNAYANLPAPILAPAAVPFAGADPAPAGALQHLDIDGERIEFVVVSMGNPHAVCFVENIQQAPVAAIGTALGQHAAFPEGVNAGFCQIVDGGFVRLRVFERGVGETQACGSGACAAVVAGRCLERLNNRVKVSLPGGKVKVAWDGGDDLVRLTGPVSTVYSGTIRS